LVAASPAVAGEGVQGLETVFFAFLVTAGILLGITARSRELAGEKGGGPRLLGSAALLALAALTRPEGVGVFGLITAAAAIWRIRHGYSPVSRGELGAVLVFLAIYLPYWFWRFDYYGYPFPNSFYAKTGGGIWHLLRGLRYVGRFFVLNPVLSLLAIWGIGGWLARKWRRGGRELARPSQAAAAATVQASDESGGSGTGAPSASPNQLLFPLALTVIVGYLGYVATVGGDFKKTFRFIIPVLPLLALLLDAVVSYRGWPRLPGRAGRAAPVPAAGRRWAGTATAWLVLVLVVINGVFSVPSTVRWARRRAWDLTRRTACGEYLASVAKPQDVLAIHSAGIIPYYSGLHTIDMWGINDRHIGHKKMPNMGRARPPGHEKEDLAYVFAQKPTYYIDEWFYVTGEPVYDLRRRHLRGAGWRNVAPFYRERNVSLLLDDGRGSRVYWFNFLERVE
jgi:hypothetical protein